MERRDTDNGADYRQLSLVGFSVDTVQPLALLRDEERDATVPLWLELADILTVTAALLAGKLAARGEGNGLLDALLDSFGLEIRAIRIDGTADAGYEATVLFAGNGEERSVMVGLVTAFLTSLTYKCPLSVSVKALASSALVDRSEAPSASLDDESELLVLLANMKPEDMGKYPM